jgi:ADP-ribose pyrophosphatase YjhB (NUDIX family)
VDVLMVTTAKGKWTFPKGLVDVTETSRSTAHKEVLEEAGVKGTLYEDSYPPKFRIVKKDWGSIEVEVTVFKMLVSSILATDDEEWPVSCVAAGGGSRTGASCHRSSHERQSPGAALEHGSHTRTHGGVDVSLTSLVRAGHPPIQDIRTGPAPPLPRADSTTKQSPVCHKPHSDGSRSGWKRASHEGRRATSTGLTGRGAAQEDEERSRNFRERAWVPLLAAMGALGERIDPEGSKGKNRLAKKGFQVAKTAARVEVMSVLRELRTLQRKD